MACPQDSSPWPWVFQRCLSLWVVLLDLLLQLHSSLHKPSLCKARHRVQICFLQTKTPETASFLARGSNCKLPGPFGTHFPKSSLFTRDYQWFVLVAKLCNPSIYWEWGKVEGRKLQGERSMGENLQLPPATPSASTLPPHCCTEWCIDPALG